MMDLCVNLPFFIRVLTWSTKGRVRSWAMESTLLGPTGFTLAHIAPTKSVRERPTSTMVTARMWHTYTFSSASGGISMFRYSLQTAET